MMSQLSSTKRKAELNKVLNANRKPYDTYETGFQVSTFKLCVCVDQRLTQE